MDVEKATELEKPSDEPCSMLEQVAAEMPYVMFALPTFILVITTTALRNSMTDSHNWSPRLIVSALLSAVVLIAGFALYGWEEKKRLQPYEVSDELTSHARILTQKLGIKLHEVRLSRGYYARNYANAWADANDGVITITRKMIEITDADEIGFILAHELAHLGQHRPRFFRATIISACSLFFIPLVYALTLPDIPWKSWWFWLTLAVPAGVAFLLSRLRGYDREEDADRKALLTTHNLNAAESCLRKMAETFLPPGTDLSKDSDLNKRVATLRRIAEEIGIASKFTPP